MKQETLEEECLNQIKNCIKYNNDTLLIRFLEQYFYSKQKQDKNKYSEEEVKNLLNKRLLSVGIISSEEATNIWFKQYTKTI